VAPMSPLVRAARRRLLAGKRGEDVIANGAKRHSRLEKIRALLARLAAPPEPPEKDTA
jgi:hypothetical protein